MTSHGPERVAGHGAAHRAAHPAAHRAAHPAAWTRRRVLGALGGGAAAIAGGSVAGWWGSAAASSPPRPPFPPPDACEVIAPETAGPFPGDGSNGPNVLADDPVVRRDITTSYGASSAAAGGVPLTLELLVVDAAGGCLPVQGAAVYVWHCDREGRYSLYSNGVEGENYLRGVQPADDDGIVSFTTVFPGCYAGRWPHVHFEVFPTLADAVAGSDVVTTSQLAFPQTACETVYATAGYEQSVANLAGLSVETDGIFGDGVATQLATMSGSPDDGSTARLVVAI